MISSDEFRKLALSLPEAEEQDHFGKPSFRVRGKIFATHWVAQEHAVLKLSLEEQDSLVARARTDTGHATGVTAAHRGGVARHDMSRI